MEEALALIAQIVPNMHQEFRQRLQMLKTLQQAERPMGRKVLANRLQVSERSLRTMLEYLKEANLVSVSRHGVMLSQHGKNVLEMLQQCQPSTRIVDLAQQLAEKLQIKRCVVVPGDCDQDITVLDRIGQVVANLLQDLLPQGPQVIAMTGGTTIAHVAQAFTPNLSVGRELQFVPARGGVGGSYDIQSNNIGGLMAERSQGRFTPLFIPENVDEMASKVLMNAPSIKQAVELSQQADCLLLSIGDAQVMADRHGLSQDQKEHLIVRQAIGEVFGVFFDRKGQEILRLPRLGIQMDELPRIPLLVTVVVGSSKAPAVKAYYQLIQHHGILVCDEGIAKKVLSGD